MPSPLSSSSSSSLFPSVMPLHLLLLISLLPTSFPSPAPPCSSSKCGDLSISYPFWLAEDPKDPPSSYCGYHGLMLFCDDSRAVLNLPGGGEYTVTHIDPSSKTFSLFDSAALAEAKDSSCPRPYYNITFNENSFLDLTSEDTDLIFYYNCSKTALLAACSSPTDGKYSYVVTSDQPLKPSGCEDMVVAPVLHSAVVGNGEFLSGNFTGVVQSGFQLRWTTAGGETCQRCESHGGTCGWDEGHGGYVCFCGGVISGQDCAGGNSTEKDGQHVGLVIGLGTGGGFSLAVVFAVGVVYARKRRTRKRSVLPAGKESLPPTSKSDPELGSSFRAPIFSYDELHEATNGFQASNILGDGGFGTVYKGKLRDGRVVAVKRLYENNSRRVEQFTNEVSILSLLRHPNLVSLYGCTPRRSPALLLVYEFVSNGTVAEHLHGSLSSSSPLVWETRMRIAVETAEALSYLHSVDPPIIHRDVKTSNILLDGSLHVKVADFGISRLFPLDATHISTAPQGTPGYLDPEYHMCYQLTDKSDVYSFGVVLLELISSKPAVDITRRRNEINLAAMAMGKMQRRELHEFVDARLGFMSDSSVEGMVSEVAEVAFRCLQAEREMRPPIKDVLEALRSIQRRRGGDERGFRGSG